MDGTGDPCEPLIHAVQSGVAAMETIDPKPTSPKHLRTGVNVAMCDHGALVKVLIEKGILTIEEYNAARSEVLQREVRSYEQGLSAAYGTKVKLA